jgi:hypothetical protein
MKTLNKLLMQTNWSKEIKRTPLVSAATKARARSENFEVFVDASGLCVLPPLTPGTLFEPILSKVEEMLNRTLPNLRGHAPEACSAAPENARFIEAD